MLEDGDPPKAEKYGCRNIGADFLRAKPTTAAQGEYPEKLPHQETHSRVVERNRAQTETMA